MSGIKFDTHKPCSYLLAHDVVIHDTEPGQGIEFYAARLRAWWNRAGTLPALQIGTADYFGTVKILEYGAKKYSERNWEEGILYSRVFRAAMDHYARRGDNDPETGEPHRYHFLCCYMFLAAYTARGLHQFDDRPGVGPFVRQAKGAGVLGGELELIEPSSYGVFWRDRMPAPYRHLSGLRAEYLPHIYSTREEAERAIASCENMQLVEPGRYVVKPL